MVKGPQFQIPFDIGHVAIVYDFIRSMELSVASSENESTSAQSSDEELVCSKAAS